MDYQPSKFPIGARFGALIITKHLPPHIEPSGYQRLKVEVRCDCGKQYDLCAAGLLRKGSPRCTDCGNASRRSFPLGSRHGKLTVREYVFEEKRTLAICQCDCGNVIKIRPALIKKNQTNHCGCSPRGNWDGLEGLSKTYLSKAKHSAQERGIPFEITLDDMWQTYQLQQGLCVYTKERLTLALRSKDDGNASLDRRDSTKGYTPDNIQWVHKDVIRMKSNLTESRFLALCHLISTSNLAKPSDT